VHLTYQTAFVDGGKLQTRRDVYNLDSRTLAAIRSERGTLEAVAERKREPGSASGVAANRPARPAQIGAIIQPTPYQAPMAYQAPAPYQAPGYGRSPLPPAFYR
jgi:hypothetical protein